MTKGVKFNREESRILPLFAMCKGVTAEQQIDYMYEVADDPRTSVTRSKALLRIMKRVWAVIPAKENVVNG